MESKSVAGTESWCRHAHAPLAAVHPLKPCLPRPPAHVSRETGKPESADTGYGAARSVARAAIGGRRPPIAARAQPIRGGQPDDRGVIGPGVRPRRGAGAAREPTVPGALASAAGAWESPASGSALPFDQLPVPA